MKAVNLTIWNCSNAVSYGVICSKIEEEKYKKMIRKMRKKLKISIFAMLKKLKEYEKKLMN